MFAVVFVVVVEVSLEVALLYWYCWQKHDCSVGSSVVGSVFGGRSVFAVALAVALAIALTVAFLW